VSVSPIGVLHLVHARNGLPVVERFVSSWEAHPAGAECRLYFGLKGFGGSSSSPLDAILGRVAHRIILLPQDGYDIGSYRYAARRMPEPVVLFLNSFSQVQSDNWLGMLVQAKSSTRAGVVGASGSWESPASVHLNRALTFGAATSAAWRARGRSLAIGALAAAIFPRFPNPHIRTNAFMLAREQFLSMSPRVIRTKLDAWMFESGRNSLTRQMIRQGLRVLVVGRDGRTYEPADWSASRTYCSGEQEYLLIQDNRTLAYQRGDSALRAERRWAAWECSAGRSPMQTTPAVISTIPTHCQYVSASPYSTQALNAIKM
jgi:hypothetical protein